MNVDEAVREAVLKIGRRKNADLTEVSDGQTLAVALRFESLDIAELVAVLERKLGIDPFTKGANLNSTRTVKDFSDAYRRCLGTTDP